MASHHGEIELYVGVPASTGTTPTPPESWGAFITGSDFLMDGGVTASYFSGELTPHGIK